MVGIGKDFNEIHKVPHLHTKIIYRLTRTEKKIDILNIKDTL